VTFEGDFAFGDEGRGNVSTGLADDIALAEDFGFWETETKDDDEDWWAGTEPEELKWISLMSCKTGK
jgi:hypothetical protein